VTLGIKDFFWLTFLDVQGGWATFGCDCYWQSSEDNRTSRFCTQGTHTGCVCSLVSFLFHMKTLVIQSWGSTLTVLCHINHLLKTNTIAGLRFTLAPLPWDQPSVGSEDVRQMSEYPIPHGQHCDSCILRKVADLHSCTLRGSCKLHFCILKKRYRV
jgi:hypothetical protein